MCCPAGCVFLSCFLCDQVSHLSVNWSCVNFEPDCSSSCLQMDRWHSRCEFTTTRTCVIWHNWLLWWCTIAFNILGMYTDLFISSRLFSACVNCECVCVCMCSCVLVWVTWKVWVLDHSRWKAKCYWVVPTSTMLQNWNTAGYSSLGAEEEHWSADPAEQSMKSSVDPRPRMETVTETKLMIHNSITLLSDTLTYIQSTHDRCFQVFEEQ